MFKIYKYLNLKNNVTMSGRVRSVCNDTGKIKQIYHCKQPEKDDEIDYEKEKRKEIEQMFKCREGHVNIWRNIFLYLCVPVILGFALNTFYLSSEKVKRPKFVEYEYLRIRRKPFPWDPVRTLFHNPRVNALPTGYETEVPEGEEYEP